MRQGCRFRGDLLPAGRCLPAEWRRVGASPAPTPATRSSHGTGNRPEPSQFARSGVGTYRFGWREEPARFGSRAGGPKPQPVDALEASAS